MKFSILRQPAAPYRPGSEREAAWHVAQAFDGCTVEHVVDAWDRMEQARGKGGNPQGWLKFFCGPHRKRSGATREVLAEIR